MTFWGFVDGIIRNPPAILFIFVVAALVAHVFKIVLEFLTKRDQPNVVIATLEIILVIVLSYVILHLYLTKDVSQNEPSPPHSDPLVLTYILVTFTIISMIIYFFFQVLSADREGK